MQRKNFIGFRDRVLLHLLRFDKDVYENIHSKEIDGTHRDFLSHLTQEGIAAGVGSKQSTIYKELLTLREPALEGGDSLIHVIDKARIPGRERVCAVYYLTHYGQDLAEQKRAYLENKHLEVQGTAGSDTDTKEPLKPKVITIGILLDQVISEGIESNQISALLRIASVTSAEGKVNWQDIVSPPSVLVAETPVKSQEPASTIPESKPKHDRDARSLDIVNPYFNRTAIKDPKYFFGRSEEVQYILSLLGNTQSCSIVGPRRVGKSSLINYISNPQVLTKYNLNPADYIFVSIDLEGLSDLTQSDFFYMILQEIRNRTTDSELRSRMEGLLQKENIRFLDLKNICSEISNLGKNIVFLLDEFELITNNKNLDCNFYSGLRNLANTYNVGYITSSHMPLLNLTLSQETLGSPFFNFFTQLDLNLMKETGVHELITTLSQANDVVFPEEIVNYIKETAGPHAFFLQVLCFHVFNRLKENGSISDSELPEITNKFVAESKSHFQYFWNHCTEEEQKLLLSIQKQEKITIQPSNQNIVQNLKKNALIIETSGRIQLMSKAFSEFLSTTTVGEIPLKDQLDGAAIAGKKLDKVSKPKTGEDIVLNWGISYFVDEAEPDISVKLYNDLSSQGIPGLFITRTPLDKVEEQWGLKDTKDTTVIWLCSRSGIGYLRPALEKVSHTIFEFIKKNKHSVVLLDGIEFIVNNNDFLKTLNLMENLKESIALHNSVLVFPISSTIFSKKEMALLKKNSVEIQKNSGFDFTNI